MLVTWFHQIKCGLDGVVNQLALQSTVYRSMSSGTARLKRRLDEQGITYTSKKAVENFCLVRLTGTEGL